MAEIIGALLAGAGTVWGAFKVKTLRNGNSNGAISLDKRLGVVESRLIPLEALASSAQVEFRNLSKSVDRLDAKVDAIKDQIADLRVSMEQ